MNDIDKIFKAGYQQYEENAPSNVWSAIENKLDKSELRYYKSRYYQTLRIAMSLFFIIMFLKLDNDFNFNFGKQFLTGHPKQLKNVGNKTESLKNKISSSNSPPSHPAENRTANANKNFDSNFKNALINNFTQEDSAGNLHANSDRDYSIVADSDHHYDNASMVQKLLNKKPAVNLSKNPDANDIRNSTSDKSIRLKKESKFSLTAVFSKNIVHNHLEEVFEFDNENESEINEREKKPVSFSAGIQADYALSKRFLLQSGLTFTSIENSVAPSSVKADEYNNTVNFLVATTYGLGVIKNPYSANPVLNDSFMLSGYSKQQLDYLTIPLLAKYRLISKNKFDVSVAAGLGANINTRAKLKVGILNNSNNEVKQVSSDIDGLKTSFYSALALAEADYKINKKISFTLQTSTSHSLTSINENVPIKNSVNIISFTGGIKISF